MNEENRATRSFDLTTSSMKPKTYLISPTHLLLQSDLMSVGPVSRIILRSLSKSPLISLILD